jgi:RimJ/RimL family protein N-acetyltransferase
MPHYPKLTGEKCSLAPVAAEDGELWARWLNDLEVVLPLGDEAYEMIPGEVAQGWASSEAKASNPVFTILERVSGQAIGRCALFSINNTDRSSMCGIFIGEKSLWGQGYGSEALRLLLDYAFNLLNLNSVMLGVFAFNQRALAVYQKIGFREIGRRRQARIFAGKKYDVILMDILAEEFESPVLKNITL